MRSLGDGRLALAVVLDFEPALRIGIAARAVLLLRNLHLTRAVAHLLIVRGDGDPVLRVCVQALTVVIHHQRDAVAIILIAARAVIIHLEGDALLTVEVLARTVVVALNRDAALCVDILPRTVAVGLHGQIPVFILPLAVAAELHDRKTALNLIVLDSDRRDRNTRNRAERLGLVERDFCGRILRNAEFRQNNRRNLRNLTGRIPRHRHVRSSRRCCLGRHGRRLRRSGLGLRRRSARRTALCLFAGCAACGRNAECQNGRAEHCFLHL